MPVSGESRRGRGASRSMRLLLVLALVALMCVPTGAVGAVRPAIALTYTVSGTVKGVVPPATTATGLQGIEVQLRDAASPDIVVDIVYTGATGAFSFPTVVAGDYKIYMQPKDANAANPQYRFLAGYLTAQPGALTLDGWTGARTITVAAGNVSAGIVTLPTGCKLTGTIKGGGAIIPAAGRFSASVTDNIGNAVADYFALVDAAGNFTTVVPADGSVVYLMAHDEGEMTTNRRDFLDRWYGGASGPQKSLASAQSLDMLVPNTTVPLGVINLPKGGVITGKVTLPGGVTPADQLDVAAQDLPDSMNTQVTSKTGADGTYVLGPIEPGPTGVIFDPTWTYNQTNLTSYVTQAWNNAPLSRPNTITVSSGTTVTAINDTLSLGRTVRVKVTNPSGTPLSGMSCSIAGKSGSGVFRDATTVAGFATFTNLPYDTYGAWANPYTYNYAQNADFVGSGLEADFDLTFASASPLTVGLPIVMQYGGRITGKVTNSALSPIVGLRVGADLADGNDTPVDTFTKADGTYVLHGVPADQRIKVNFATYEYNQDHNTDYVHEWWNRKWDFRTADITDVIAVAPPSATTGIYTGRNAVLTTGAQVGGRITSPGGVAGLKDAYVQLFDVYGNSVDSLYSDASGYYRFRAVPPGIYRISAMLDGTYPERWWNGAAAYATANNLVTVAGTSYAGKNIELKYGPTLSGKVTRYGTLTGLANVPVRVRDYTGNVQAETVTRSDGSWSIVKSPALAPGSYKVQFGPAAPYGLGWYTTLAGPSASSAAAGGNVLLGYGSVTGGVNGYLKDVGTATLSGTAEVKGQIGVHPMEPYHTLAATAYALCGTKWREVASGVVNQTTGAFSITGLAPGQAYKLGFEDRTPADSKGTWGRQFYVGGSSVSWPEMAKTFTPVAGVNAAGVFRAQKGGLFVVKTYDINSNTLENVDVFMDFYNPATGTWWPVDGGYMGYSMASGEVDLPSEQFYDVPLMPGRYRFRFERYGCDTVWYDTASTAAAATPVDLPSFVTDDWSTAKWVEQTVLESGLTTEQMAAPDRYGVAANLALEAHPGYTGIKNVVIASGLDRSAADPLSASGLAGVYDAPILLVRQDLPTLPSATFTALRKIALANPTTKVNVWIVGGPASVPEALKAQITLALGGAAHTGPYVRFSGLDRYQVSSAVAAHVRGKTGAKSCFVTNGSAAMYFWDALAVSPVAYQKHFPILLSTASFPPASVAAEAANYTAKYVIGDTTHVNESVRASLVADRISGGNRADVARRFSEIAWSRGWIGLDKVAIGNKLADSLAGGVAIGTMGGTMLYTGDGVNKAWTLLPETTQFLSNYKAHITDVYLLGGTGSIDNTSVMAAVNAALGK